MKVFWGKLCELITELLLYYCYIIHSQSMRSSACGRGECRLFAGRAVLLSVVLKPPQSVWYTTNYKAKMHNYGRRAK